MTTEAVQDIVGAMVTGNTETNIAVAYDDTDGTLDFTAEVGASDVAITGTANGLNNRIATYSGADALNGEANLTFDGSILAVTGELSISKQAYFSAAQAISHSSGNISIDWRLGNKLHLTISTGNGYTVDAFTDPDGPCNLVLKIIQGDGSNTITTWPPSEKWASSAEPTLSTGSGDVDIFTFYFDGTNYYGAALTDFGT